MYRCFQNVLLVIALAGLFVSSWGACVEGEYSGSFNGEFCFAEGHGFCGFPSENGCITSGYYAGKCLCSNYQIDEICPSSGYNGGYLSVPFRIARQIDNCPNISAKTECYYKYRCSTQAEADSVANSLDCDKPENWKCSTSSSIVKVQETSPDIVCDASFGGCYSGNACSIYTEYSTTCKNECSGDSTVESYRTDPIWQDGFCDEVDIDRDDCGPTRCIDMDGNFSLVHDCNSNNVVNGEIQRFPVVIMGGKGSCASNGYQPVNPDSLGNNGNSSNRDSILKAMQDSLYSQKCLLFGLCGDSNDSTDFADSSNRNPENGCYCERLDDLPFVSRIVCPDGTFSIFYGSCKDWESKPSSSSSAYSSDSQSSSSVGGGSSEADPRPTDWANWSQANEINDKLDANNGILASISDKLSNIFSFLSDGAGSGSFDNSDGLTSSIDWDNPQYVDSAFVYDTNQVSIFGDVSDSLFNLARSNKGLIDTSSVADVSGCFTCRFTFPRGLGGQSFELNFGSLGGFNICRILRSLLIILTEITCLILFIKVFISPGGK